MKNQILSRLLTQFFHRKVTPEEFSCLKEEINKTKENELEFLFQNLWEESEINIQMQREEKTDLLGSLFENISQQKKKKRILTMWGKVALWLLPICLSASLWFLQTPPSPTQDFVVFTEKGHKNRLLLPDGTSVWLNSQSTLTYSSAFNHQNRTVRLNGEAFFDVTHHTDNPFIVETEKINVVVEGTAFNVLAYDDEEQISVSLLRGKVSLFRNDNEASLAQLKPNQKFSISKTDFVWNLYTCNAELESLWTYNILKFEDAPMMEVYKKLEHWYGMTITIKNPDEKIRYGFMVKNESIRELLELINRLTPIEYSINGEEVEIRYK